MTSELGPTARALLDAARAGLSPDAAAIRRVRAGLDATLGASAAATTPSSAATTPSSASTTPSSAATATTTASASTKLGILKLSLLVSAVALVGVGTALYVTRTPDKPSRPAAATAAAPPRTPDTGQPTAAPAGQARTPDTGQTQPRTPDTGQTQPRTPDTGQTQPRTPDTGQTGSRTPDTGQPASVARPTGPARSADAVGTKHVELAREVELVDLAMASLRAHDYQTALAAARQHARETGGGGQLAEDAAAIEIEAMCHLHQSVFTKLEAFDARWPSSAQRSRLTASCR